MGFSERTVCCVWYAWGKAEKKVSPQSDGRYEAVGGA